jgi:hypothetical protein
MLLGNIRGFSGAKRVKAEAFWVTFEVFSGQKRAKRAPKPPPDRPKSPLAFQKRRRNPQKTPPKK